MIRTPNLQPLVDLGLTSLEAEVYAFLLENSPATGYGAAKGLGKPAANVYKALESLQNKGAILVEDSKTRLCRAVPARELLESLERQFRAARDEAAAELNRLRTSPEDQRVYQLKTVEQVIGRHRRMLADCKRVGLFDLFPFAVDMLKPDIEAAAARGVEITVKVYAPTEIVGVEIFLDSRGEEILGKWPGQWANGVIDGAEHVVAYLSRDLSRVHQAVWSCSPVLSLVYYGGLVNELAVEMLWSRLDKGLTMKKVRETLANVQNRLTMEAAGFLAAADKPATMPTE